MSHKPQASINYSPAICGLCRGKGNIGSEEYPCKACGERGSLLVAEPHLKCAKCSGTGIYLARYCEICDSTGWAHVYRHDDSELAANLSIDLTEEVKLQKEFWASAKHLLENSSKSIEELTSFRAEVRNGLNTVVNWVGGVQNLLANLSFVIYLVGVSLAFGMNWGIKGQGLISSLFFALFSWLNVGYNLTAK